MELDPQWVVGFVDGEGCFHVSLNRHDEMTAGYQVLPEFVVVQHERDIQILHALKRFFRGGVVRQNHGDRYCLRVRKLSCPKGNLRVLSAQLTQNKKVDRLFKVSKSDNVHGIRKASFVRGID